MYIERIRMGLTVFALLMANACAALQMTVANSEIFFSENNKSDVFMRIGAQFDTSCQKWRLFSATQDKGGSEAGSKTALFRFYGSVKSMSLEEHLKALKDDGTKQAVKASISSNQKLSDAFRNVNAVKCDYALSVQGGSIYRVTQTISMPNTNMQINQKLAMVEVCADGVCTLSNQLFREESLQALLRMIDESVGNYQTKEPNKAQIYGAGVSGRFKVLKGSKGLDLPIFLATRTLSQQEKSMASTKLEIRKPSATSKSEYFLYRTEGGTAPILMSDIAFKAIVPTANEMKPLGVLQEFHTKNNPIYVFDHYIKDKKSLQLFGAQCTPGQCILDGFDPSSEAWKIIRSVAIDELKN